MNAALEYGTIDVEVVKFQNGTHALATDSVVVEEPLEIQVRTRNAPEQRTICTTMRSPGHDRELAAGFLFNEAVIRDAGDIAHIAPWGPFRGESHVQNVCRVDLNLDQVEFGKLERHFYSNSSCGVCGRASVATLMRCANARLSSDGAPISSAVILALPRQLREFQEAFDCTGGLHATALFNREGELQVIREDVGRHNAMDKVAGHLLLNAVFSSSDRVLLVSGRLSFELVQKAVMLGVPVLCGLGAPSSIAAELAQKTGLTLVGFVRENRFNVYANPQRVAW